MEGKWVSYCCYALLDWDNDKRARRNLVSSPTKCDGKVQTVNVQADYNYAETLWFVTDSDGEEIMAVDEYSSPYEMISKSL